MPMLRAAALVLATMVAWHGAAAEYAKVPGGAFVSVLGGGDAAKASQVAPYAMATMPVTNAEFLAFVTRHPEWRRGSAPALFADGRYLERWQGPLALGAEVAADAPVTGVSWYAARAYCEADGARLPTWLEWEFAAAADATRADARHDPEWRQRMLDWYAERGGQKLGAVGRDPANLYGLHDLAAGVWEWVDDFNALLVSSDDREQGAADLMKFCGAGALTMRDREAYAVLMRVAMLSSLEARSTTRDLGFRCARSIAPPEEKSR